MKKKPKLRVNNRRKHRKRSTPAPSPVARPRSFSVRGLVGAERLERAIYETAVSAMATRIQSTWQEQHVGEPLDMTRKALDVQLEARHIAEFSVEITNALLRVFDTMMVRT